MVSLTMMLEDLLLLHKKQVNDVSLKAVEVDSSYLCCIVNVKILKFANKAPLSESNVIPVLNSAKRKPQGTLFY